MTDKLLSVKRNGSNLDIGIQLDGWPPDKLGLTLNDVKRLYFECQVYFSQVCFHCGAVGRWEDGLCGKCSLELTLPKLADTRQLAIASADGKAGEAGGKR